MFLLLWNYIQIMVAYRILPTVYIEGLVDKLRNVSQTLFEWIQVVNYLNFIIVLLIKILKEYLYTLVL